MTSHLLTGCRNLCKLIILLLIVFGLTATAYAQPTSVPQILQAPTVLQPNLSSDINGLNPTGLPGGMNPDQMLSPGGMSSTLKLFLMMTVMSMAPAIVMMTTCFIRIVVVMGFLRQALGTTSLPPNQVVISLSLFMTAMVMWPVWNTAYEDGILPYSNQTFRTPAEQQAGLKVALEKTLLPMREFMSSQISQTGNDSAVWLFLDYTRPKDGSPEAATYKPPETFADVPTTVLIPAYMLSELKTAFIIGFQIYLPFLVIDMVVSAILISTGMMMLPPAVISMPFKLLLFVLVDGWTLTVEMLLNSIHQATTGGTG
jgi:flagellar biosynthetic protein FliP